MSEQNSGSQSTYDNRFAAIIDQSPFSIQIMSPDGFTIRVNKAWEKLWGLTLEQIRDYNMLEDQQLEKQGVMPYIKSAFNGEYAEIPAIPYDPKETVPDRFADDEPIKWTRAVIYPIKDDEGQIQEVVLMHEDITTQIRSEEKIKESESRYRLLFETSLDGIMIVDGNGKYVDVNESLCKILKTPREKLIGSHFGEYMLPERIEDARKAFTDLQEKGYFTGDFPMRAGDGRIVELTWSSRANFMPGLHVCVARDITARKLAEDALRESEERYRSLLENANDIIYSHDLQGKYLAINRAGEKITGYTQESILRGMNIVQIIAPEHLELAKEMTERKLLDPNAQTLYEVDIFAKDGRRLTLEVNTRIAFNDGKPVAVEGIARDITERKRIEKDKTLLAEQMEKQRKRLQEMVSDVPAVVWESWDVPDSAEQRINFVSDYVEKMLGYSVDEWLLVPNFWVSIIHPDDKEKAVRNAAEAFVSGKPGSNRFRLLAKDGRVVWVETQSTPIFNDEGNPVGLRGVTIDITERKKKEDNERFLTEASVMLASSLDYETTLSTLANLSVPQFADWCGVDIAVDDGLLRRLAVAHIDPAKVAWAHEIYEQYPPDPDEPQGLYNVFRTGKSEFYPYISDDMLLQGARDENHLEILRRVGFRSVMLVPLKAREKVLGVLTFVNSESGRSHTLEDLALAEDLANRAALAVDNARLYQAEQQSRLAAERNSILLKRLQAVSQSLSKVLSLSEVVESVVEQAIVSLGAHAGTVVLLDSKTHELEMVGSVSYSDETLKKWRRFSLDQKVPLADAVRNGVPVIIESFDDFLYRYPMLNSLTPITGSQALAAFPLIIEGRIIGALGLSFPAPQNFSGDDRAFMSALAQQCAQAIERTRLYETEKSLREEAETANRIKDEFLATLSHELRTPLNSILGWSQMLRNGSLAEGAKEKALVTIERNARLQNQLIDDVLDISRIITGKLRLDIRPIDLSGVIVAAAESLRPAMEAKKIRLKTSLDPRTELIQGDSERLQQVMWNLLSNAVKFTPDGGEIQISLYPAGTSVEVVVTDTGIGIEEGFLPFVFDRFRQLDGSTTRSHGGLGLGLSIVRQIVEMHGGTILAENNRTGIGASFTLKLPVLNEGKPSWENPQRLSLKPQTKQTFNDSESLAGVRILLVEDEEDSREFISFALNNCGALVTDARSASEAYELIKKQRFDLLISDIGMPEEDGYSLIKKIRALSANEGGTISAIALTAYARNEDRAKALEAGFQIHLPKPIEPLNFIDEVTKLIRKDSNFD
jgi:PAS domain S-box-containing protein